MKRLNPPKVATWIIALILLIVGLVLALNPGLIPGLGRYAFWLPVGGLILMLVATTVKGL